MSEKALKAAYDRVYNATHRDERRAKCRVYDATHREEIAARRAAHYTMHREESAAYAKAYRSAHKEEIAARDRAYHTAHRTYLLAYQKTYTAAHPQENAVKGHRRRALKRGATIGPIDLTAIRLRDRMVCCICGRKVVERDFSLDHTIPLVQGGAHTQNNLRVAHLHCNKRRGAGRLPVQMVLY